MLIGFDLLDRQILDRDGEPVGKVDDVDRGPIRIPYDLVSELNSAINLSVHRELLPDPALESWLRDHLISRIPGASDAS
jgi:hypothetical protein